MVHCKPRSPLIFAVTGGSEACSLSKSPIVSAERWGSLFEILSNLKVLAAIYIVALGIVTRRKLASAWYAIISPIDAGYDHFCESEATNVSTVKKLPSGKGQPMATSATQTSDSTKTDYEMPTTSFEQAPASSRFPQFNPNRSELPRISPELTKEELLETPPRLISRARANASTTGSATSKSTEQRETFWDHVFKALWPTFVAIFVLFSAGEFYSVWAAPGPYNAQANLAVVAITVLGGGAMMMLYKWVLRGQDGLPSLRDE